MEAAWGPAGGRPPALRYGAPRVPVAVSGWRRSAGGSQPTSVPPWRAAANAQGITLRQEQPLKAPRRTHFTPRRASRRRAINHDEHHAQPHGSRWVLATDHKDVVTLYLLFSLTMLMTGGVLALGICAELFQPGLQLFNPEFYNQLVTIRRLLLQVCRNLCRSSKACANAALHERAPALPVRADHRQVLFKAMRDYLVFVRAGRNSLHPEMLADDPDRNWDCCINGWEAPPGSTARDFGVESFYPGALNKFEAFDAMFGGSMADMPYRYVMMIDDDLRFTPGDVSRFFELCESHCLFLCQPAIGLGSNANHLINIRNPVCEIRQVNFVEVMAPCFSREALQVLLQTFRLTRCTWGIDYAWSSLLDGQSKISIVDAVPMDHTKPMDRAEGPFYRRLRSMGIEPDEELAAVHRNFPPWGEMRTLPQGHRYARAVRGRDCEGLVAWMEQRKIDAHLARGGTIAPQRPVSSGLATAPMAANAERFPQATGL